MPKTTTKKKAAKSKDVAQASLKERVLILEMKVAELEGKVTAAVERTEMIKSAVAEGRLDKL